MPPDSPKPQKPNLRILKTERALIKSMGSLLNECRFAKVTVDGLCKEGQLSRATFYSHFMDKYNLLEFWLLSIWTYDASGFDTYESTKEYINNLVTKNRKIIKNILIDADHQTLEIVQNFFCVALGIKSIKPVGGNTIQKNVVMVNLCVGGIVAYLLWQVRNNFPPDTPVINEYSFDAIKRLRDWSKEQ